jgi:predicted RNA-binding Zn ribbon-like protein
MTYAQGHPVRAIGGRLALDFVNTADWDADGGITHEKITTLSDFAVWCEELGLGRASPPSSVKEILRFRTQLRSAFVDNMINKSRDKLSTSQRKLRQTIAASLPCAAPNSSLSIITMSALSILWDHREYSRIKLCPGSDCGWLFMDETKNARRKWCMMETCGNRAKASRHYERQKISA